MKKPSHLKAPKPAASLAGFGAIPTDVCQSVGDVLGRIGDKWSILAIAMLSGGSMRFTELKRSLGSISQKVLTSTLRGLERDGYISRTVTPSIPPRVDYELTELGHDVLVPVSALAQWALSQHQRVRQARTKFDGSVAKH